MPISRTGARQAINSDGAEGMVMQLVDQVPAVFCAHAPSDERAAAPTPRERKNKGPWRARPPCRWVSTAATRAPASASAPSGTSTPYCAGLAHMRTYRKVDCARRPVRCGALGLTSRVRTHTRSQRIASSMDVIEPSTISAFRCSISRPCKLPPRIRGAHARAQQAPPPTRAGALPAFHRLATGGEHLVLGTPLVRRHDHGRAGRVKLGRAMSDHDGACTTDFGRPQHTCGRPARPSICRMSSSLYSVYPVSAYCCVLLITTKWAGRFT
jgi:hypothetical protein